MKKCYVLFVSIIILFFINIINHETPFILIALPFLVLMVFSFYDYYKSTYRYISFERPSFQIKEIIWLSMSVLCTYILHSYLNLNPVLSASLIGFLGGFFIKKYNTLIYCGTFVGMTTQYLLPIAYVGISILVCYLVYKIAKPYFSGIGGTLGTIAFLSTFPIALFIKSSDYMIIEITPINAIIILISSISTMILLLYIKRRSTIDDVLLSSGVSLLAASIFSFFDFGIWVIPVVFATSFLIMSSEKYTSRFVFMILTTVILSIIMILSHSVFYGLGGKAGLTALVSILMAKTLLETFKLKKN